MTVTRAGSLRSHVKTTVPRKRLGKINKDGATLENMGEEVSESQY